MTKQTVYYTQALGPIIAGYRARVLGYSHYRLGRVPEDMFMNTSPVVTVGEDGTTFETLNSLYVLREAVEADEPLLIETTVVEAV